MSYRYGPDRYKDGSLVNHWVEPTATKWPAAPWDFEWVSAPASGGGHLYIIDATGRKIAAIWGKAEEKEFAARLVAATPELYAAVKAAAEFFEEQLDADIDAHIPSRLHGQPRDQRRAAMLEHEGHLNAIADLEENLARTNAAMAKARGEP